MRPQSSRPNANRPGRLDVDEYVEGVVRQDRTILARAITVIESELPSDEEAAAAILDRILPYTGNSKRVGVTGAPGVGKSTFIEALGMHLIREYGESIAVLSIDPTSPLSGGSILGDKTRMVKLSLEDKAFIRPSPSRGHLGGVARRTREAILLCEAAGFQNVFVETVGVGQSETAVRSMTDFFLLLMMPGAGDELQGIKRGIIELIDAMAITKADGDNVNRANQARAEFSNTLHLFPSAPDGWSPRVLTVSALTGHGVNDLWQIVCDHRDHLEMRGLLEVTRRIQALAWMQELIAIGLSEMFRHDPRVVARRTELERAVENRQMAPLTAARDLLALFRK